MTDQEAIILIRRELGFAHLTMVYIVLLSLIDGLAMPQRDTGNFGELVCGLSTDLINALELDRACNLLPPRNDFEARIQ